MVVEAAQSPQLNLLNGGGQTQQPDTATLLLNALIGDSLKKVTAEAQQTVLETKQYVQEEIERIKNTVNENLKVFDSDNPLVINVGTIEKPKKAIVHKAFAQITKILASAKRKEKNIMLVGAAGGGKTHLVSSIAEAMKLPFYPMSVGLQTTKSDLLGFINATGGYVTSPVRQAYENGGVLLLDEFDAAHAGVVTILNSLLANGHCSFPDKIVEKNPNFVCICACNTYGKGANVDYVGRNRLDAATLDRFIVVDVDYDTKLEKKLTKNDQWLEIIKKVRNNAEKQGVKVIISPRASMDGADLIDGGFTIKEVLEMTIFKGADKDVQTKLLKDINLDKYGNTEPTEPTEPKGGLTMPTVNIDIDLDSKKTYVSKFEEYLSAEIKESHCGRYSDIFKICNYKVNLADSNEKYSMYAYPNSNEIWLNSGEDDNMYHFEETKEEILTNFRDVLKSGNRITAPFNVNFKIVNDGVIEKFFIYSTEEIGE